ncbi:phosphoribosyl-aminoimidazole-succinocarboxamide synthase [Saccharata proteae CBS 121410]|uniref:Phosphoribosylaminoimidazole-succinocarboxamide synthase n=1 Tax=Saccharata proteae CBS 121410 TaxID=1314787 RepID=A0A9P4I0I0_9PEZI|nr:phosphoribosyl-aminoimidazole-succinocarboxamide synthase [Saccharata proteae CBS 121410]
MSAVPQAVESPDLHGNLKLLAKGKVRDVYELDNQTLLFVATDRISAYDVIMKNGIPQKGALLTALSTHWFDYLSTQIPELRTHFVSSSLPSPLLQKLPASEADALRERSMQVRRLKIFPIEAIVRGYITGSAWKEYCEHRTVHGMQMPQGLQESEKLPTPIYTPSTKAEVGGKDENISKEKAAQIVGDKVAHKIEELSLQLYQKAAAHALSTGIIIADTKFEFGFDPEDPETVILVDEVLTPDSSRFWPATSYKVGQGQDSFDKQYLRDWLTKEGLKGKEDVSMPDEIVVRTRSKYIEAYERLTGRQWGGKE